MQHTCLLLYPGSLFGALADKLHAHWPLLFLCSIGALLGRTSLAFLHSFPLILAVVVGTEALIAPVSVLSDIAIMSASSDVRLGLVDAQYVPQQDPVTPARALHLVEDPLGLLHGSERIQSVS